MWNPPTVSEVECVIEIGNCLQGLLLPHEDHPFAHSHGCHQFRILQLMCHRIRFLIGFKRFDIEQHVACHTALKLIGHAKLCLRSPMPGLPLDLVRKVDDFVDEPIQSLGSMHWPTHELGLPTASHRVLQEGHRFFITASCSILCTVRKLTPSASARSC